MRQGEERIAGAGVVGVIEDKSEGGFLIRHNLPLRPDEVLTVITARDSILTRVVWCRVGEDSSECGVAINSTCAFDSAGRQARRDWSVVQLAADE